MDEKIIKKNAVPVIAAMITALAFSFTGLPMDGNTSVEKMSDVYNGLGCTSLLAWILLLILYVKGWEDYRKYRNWQAHVLAVIFSAGMLLGTSYFTNGNWDFLFGAKKQILISAGCFIGFYIICDMGITYFWRIPEMELFPKSLRAYPGQRGRSNVVPPGKDIYDHWMDTVYPGISPRFDPGRWISAAGCIFGSHAAGQSSSMGPDDDHGWTADTWKNCLVL